MILSTPPITKAVTRSPLGLPLQCPPYPRPRLLVHYLLVNDDGSGTCLSERLYSLKWHSPHWPTLNERYVALMELQVITDLASSVAETVYRGDQAISIKQRRAMDDDLDVVWAVLDDAWRTTGRHYALAA
jgi:hypothetical protein